MTSVLCIIPARGGSKRLKNKNIKPIGPGGRPMIGFALQAAIQAPSVDRVVVSTDSQRIAERAAGCWSNVSGEAYTLFSNIAERHVSSSIFPFGLRPAHLATDTATSEDVIIHTLDWLAENEGYEPDLVALLQVTSPLRTAVDVELAIRLWRRGIQRGIDPDRRPVVSVDATTKARNGALYLASPTWIRAKHGAEPATEETTPSPTDMWEPCVRFEMPHERSVDVDDAADFALAEFLMGER